MHPLAKTATSLITRKNICTSAASMKTIDFGFVILMISACSSGRTFPAIPMIGAIEEDGIVDILLIRSPQERQISANPSCTISRVVSLESCCGPTSDCKCWNRDWTIMLAIVITSYDRIGQFSFEYKQEGVKMGSKEDGQRYSVNCGACLQSNNGRAITPE